MKQLPKNYDHKEAEKRIQLQWEAEGVYAWDNTQPRENTFVIDTPPPTVSGVLHMGHIFSYTQADFVARYQRMKGKTVFYPMGFDDNGLPTERLVEKEKKVRGSAMPRDEFVALCREVVKNAEDEFRNLFKSVAVSVDWSQEYQTISDEVRMLSQMSFLDLMRKGEAYRDFRPTYWDWVDQTAIAQAEIENKEMPGTMNEIEFMLEGETPIVIATTRPELLGACVAVMYHPDDPNASNYKGQIAVTPLFDVKVPMIADSAVERDKGTGLVMCCTFGDDTDKEWWRAHNLPMRPVLATNGKIEFTRVMKDDLCVGLTFTAARDGKQKAMLDETNTQDFEKTLAVFGAIEGLKPKQANSKILEMLEVQGKLRKQTPIMHTVKCAERSGTPIEIIPTYQWFIKVVDKKEALITKGNECKWYPEFMHIRLNQWIEGLKEDWCISRQRFFGVPFPVWYSKREGEEGKVLVADVKQLPVDPLTDAPEGYTRDEVIPCTDVMDTWATSSISPQINAKGISKNRCVDATRYEQLFPADLRPQAHEIIRTWAFYTIVKAHLHENSIPWKNLMISGWCLASDKTKMSKSKGNVVTPVDLIIDKGADVVRYWASTSRLGADTAFSEDLLKIGRKLVTKLWNATSFAGIHLSKLSGKPSTAAEDVASGRISETLDKWILARLRKTIVKATSEFENFEYCDARVAIEEFFWKDFCDNYLELVKARAYGEVSDEAGSLSAHLTLYHCLDAILRLFAPFVPHVTEELYTHLFDGQGSIHRCGNWPKAEAYPADDNAEQSGIYCVSILEAIRKAKSERQVSIKFPVQELVLASLQTDWQDIAPVVTDLKSAGTVQKLEWVDTLPEDGVYTEDRRFTLALTFAESAQGESAA
ncbi:MAG TPA: valine--tRNA ligase [Rickettsiales bacterium]|nr:valine--tRNA ligase [Rickettsiales bacterium]